MENNDHRCLNCNTIVNDEYCSHCGQSSHEHRIDAHYFLHDIPHSVFHVDKGFFYTLKMMFSKPGKMIKEYLDGKRIIYFRPFAYVLLMTTICSLLIKGIHIFIEKWSSTTLQNPTQDHFFSKYFSVFIFIMIPIASIVTWITFYKNKYNFWEHFLANTYVAAQLNILILLINLVNLVGIMFKIQFSNYQNTLFIILFLSAFLYMYGSVFGFLMTNDRKNSKLVVIAKIVVMNFVLALIYFGLMQYLGVIS